MQREKEMKKIFVEEKDKILQNKKSCVMHGDFYTPQNVADFIAGLLISNEKSSPTLYDPCCGSGTLLLASDNAAKYSLFGQTLEENCRDIIKMNALLKNTEINLGEKAANTLSEDLFRDVKFDCIIANPPFNMANWRNKEALADERWDYGIPPKFNANFAWLQHVIFHLKKDGVAAVIMPNNSLTGYYTEERHIRANIFSAGIVEAIITLPQGLFLNTRIPCCIWVLNKNRKPLDAVLLVDVQRLCLKNGRDVSNADFRMIEEIIYDFRKTGQISTRQGAVVIPFEKIEENKFILSPNFYMQEDISQKYFEMILKNVHKEMVKCWKECFGNSGVGKDLESLTQEYLMSIKWDKYSMTELFDITGGLVCSKSVFENGNCPIVDTKTIIANAVLPKQLNKFANIEEDIKQKLNIRFGDFLMNRTSESVEKLGCCSFVAEDCNAIFNGYVKRLRPKCLNDVDIFYELGYLSSLFYRKEIERVSIIYTTRANLNNMQLERVNIYFPPDDTRKIISNAISCIVDKIMQTNIPREKSHLFSLISLIGDYTISMPLLLKEIHNGRMNEK